MVIEMLQDSVMAGHADSPIGMEAFRHAMPLLMGWTGSTDPLPQAKLRFPTREATVKYAQRQGLRFEVHEPTHI